MADLKPKESPSEKPVAPSVEEKVSVPTEVSSAQEGIHIKLEGDFVTLKLSQYLAEHIGQFRSCQHVVVKFKCGQAPDITAIHEHGV